VEVEFSGRSSLQPSTKRSETIYSRYSMRHFIFIVIAWCFGISDAFITQKNAIRGPLSLKSTSQDSHDATGSKNYASCACPSRRSMAMGPIVASLLTLITSEKAYAADGSLNVLVGQLKESSKMMDGIPDLIKAEKWDAGELFRESMDTCT
jgi:hypothetical protein